jgi:rhamnulokinase
MSLLAVDLGGSSGKVSRGRFDGERLTVDEVHRFANDPVWVGDRFQWDILRILHEIKQGFRAAKAGGEIASFGIDSWGLDFGLLDANDELIGSPGHYRDPRNIPAMEQALATVSREEIFARTGAQFLPVNTLYQLVAMCGSPALERARTLLQIPDLLRFFLTGERTSEYTNATTTQCISIATGDWDRELLAKLGLPTGILQPVVRGPLEAGVLRPSVRAELDLPDDGRVRLRELRHLGAARHRGHGAGGDR